MKKRKMCEDCARIHGFEKTCRCACHQPKPKYWKDNHKRWHVDWINGDGMAFSTGPGVGFPFKREAIAWLQRTGRDGAEVIPR